MQGKYITDEAWNKMFKFFQTAKHIYIGNEENLKKFIEAIYWIARTGAQWRELPEKYGRWNSIFKRFCAWSKKRIWDYLFEFCADDHDFEYQMIDATIECRSYIVYGGNDSMPRKMVPFCMEYCRLDVARNLCTIRDPDFNKNENI